MPRFFVNYQIQGTATDVIEAATKEEAESIVEARVDSDSFEPDLEIIDDVNWRISELHSVIRDGKPLNTTYVLDSDTRVSA